MFKFILVSLTVFGTSLSANAALTVSCKTQNISTQLQFDGSMVHLTVYKNKTLVHSQYGYATFNEKWNSIAVDGTTKTSEETTGVKIYFESSRTENKLASIRPYGSTAETLFPGNEGIIVVGMTCDQSYQAILSEVRN